MGKLRLGDLGPQIQKLLKALKKTNIDTDAELLEFVSVKDIARVYDDQSRNLSEEQIWANLMATLAKRRLTQGLGKLQDKENAARAQLESDCEQSWADIELSHKLAGRSTVVVSEEAQERECIEQQEEEARTSSDHSLTAQHFHLGELYRIQLAEEQATREEEDQQAELYEEAPDQELTAEEEYDLKRLAREAQEDAERAQQEALEAERQRQQEDDEEEAQQVQHQETDEHNQHVQQQEDDNQDIETREADGGESTQQEDDDSSKSSSNSNSPHQRTMYNNQPFGGFPRPSSHYETSIFNQQQQQQPTTHTSSPTPTPEAQPAGLVDRLDPSLHTPKYKKLFNEAAEIERRLVEVRNERLEQAQKKAEEAANSKEEDCDEVVKPMSPISTEERRYQAQFQQLISLRKRLQDEEKKILKKHNKGSSSTTTTPNSSFSKLGSAVNKMAGSLTPRGGRSREQQFNQLQREIAQQHLSA